jgi:hypothetical protein
MLCNHLEIRVGGARTSIMSLKGNIESLQPFLDESLSALGKTKSRLSEIDTEDLEVNEVLHGLTSMSQQYNIREYRRRPELQLRNHLWVSNSGYSKVTKFQVDMDTER